MAETPQGSAPDDRPLGLAAALEEDVAWPQLLQRVHRSIERREVSGQAVELTMQGLTGVIVEYLRAIFESWGQAKGGRRAD